MANVYCTITQLGYIFDTRAALQLSNDDPTATTLNSTTAQALLDFEASVLDSYLYGRYTLPITPVPGCLTLWVGIRTIRRLYGRRADVAANMKDDFAWCDIFMEDLREGRAQIPGVPKANRPQLAQQGTGHVTRISSNWPPNSSLMH